MARKKPLHAKFPGGAYTGVICGVQKSTALLASKPEQVSCATCRVYIEAHPEHYPPGRFIGWQGPDRARDRLLGDELDDAQLRLEAAVERTAGEGR